MTYFISVEFKKDLKVMSQSAMKLTVCKTKAMNRYDAGASFPSSQFVLTLLEAVRFRDSLTKLIDSKEALLSGEVQAGDTIKLAIRG